MKDKLQLQKLLDLLYKKAKGYSVKEVSEEFSLDDNGTMVLTKKKVQSKHIAPDISALKYFLELNGDVDLSVLSDEELHKEKVRLFELLKSDLDLCKKDKKPSTKNTI